jgi:hypothetical protein
VVLTPGQKVLIVGPPLSRSAGSGAHLCDAGTEDRGGPRWGLNPATQVTVIDVQVSADAGVAVAQLASTGNLALILLPAGR